MELHKERIRKIFEDVNPANANELPLGRLKEFWLQLSLATRCVAVRAGTEYKLGQQLSNDQESMYQLHEFVCLAHYLEQKNADKPE